MPSTDTYDASLLHFEDAAFFLFFPPVQTFSSVSSFPSPSAAQKEIRTRHIMQKKQASRAGQRLRQLECGIQENWKFNPP
jgi:hypothetical protein